MTVNQYATKLIELFASYLVLDEEKKVEKFKCGLDYKIREWVCAFRIKNFFELVTQATIIEEDVQ